MPKLSIVVELRRGLREICVCKLTRLLKKKKKNEKRRYVHSVLVQSIVSDKRVRRDLYFNEMDKSVHLLVLNRQSFPILISNF